MLATMAQSGERESGGRPKKRFQRGTIKLSDLGLGKTQSHRWQQLAKISEKKFEDFLARFKVELDLQGSGGLKYNKLLFLIGR